MYTIIGNDQRVYGPVTADELRQWIAEGRANGQSQAQLNGEMTWRALAAFPEFAAALSTATTARSVPVYESGAPYRLPKKSNGLAVAGFVLSLVSVPCCCVWVFSIVGLVLSIAGLVRSRHDVLRPGKGLAVAGIIISIISILLALLFWGLVFGGYMQNGSQLFPDTV
jgi:hypothetical protein